MDNSNTGLVQWLQDLFYNLFSGQTNHSDRANAPSHFAMQIDTLFPPHVRILEIGCGFGHDAAFFAEKEHQVTALDVAHPIIERAKRIYRSNPNINFLVQDIASPLPFPDESFDIIYAHYSLHYFTDQQTRLIFTDLTRVLKPFGLFCFTCRSTKDGEYGKGKKLDGDVFIRNKRIRHFFTTGYAAYCLGNNFKVIINREVTEAIQNRALTQVDAIQTVARKR